MGVAITNSEATAVLNARFSGAPYTPPPGHTVSLHTADPGPTDAPQAEVTGGGYSRQVVGFNPSSAGGVVANDGPVTFPNMPAVVVAWFEVHATGAAVPGVAGGPPTPGPQIRPQTRAALASPVSLTAGQSLTIAAGALTVGIA